MGIPYPPVATLKEQLEAELQTGLKGRGEAHITVISPPELKQLRSLLSLEDIHAVVEKSHIQATPITILCLGRAEVKTQNRQLATYFIVVEAVGLRALRERIDQVFEARGGRVEAFDPGLFDPHITVGFTDRDLHRQDGVVKNRSSCYRPITLVP
jgi:2'-5' RNA ligase